MALGGVPFTVVYSVVVLEGSKGGESWRGGRGESEKRLRLFL